MKKLLSVLIVLSLACALFLVPASAKGKVVDIKIEGEYIAVRGSDKNKLDVLYDGSVLSAADAGATDFNKAGIVLVQNTNCASEIPSECTITFEFESATDIDTVYINWYVYGNAMIGLPHEGALIIGTSADGVVFDENAYTIEGEPDLNSSFQLESKVRLNSAVKAKFVSITFSMGPNGQAWDKLSWEWIGLTEVGAGLEADEILGGYDEVSQEESIDLNDIEPIVEIPEGAKFIKHVPFNKSIATDSNTIITDPTAVSDYNVAWSACVLLRPTEVEGEYSVVAVKAADGDYEFAFEGVEEGDIAFAIHGESTDAVANRDALAALVEGDIVYFAGYDFEEETFETGAVVYYAVPSADDEVSETPDDSSEPVDESEPADESTPADESVPATNNSEDESTPSSGKETNVLGTGAIIGIVAGVVAVIAIVVVVVIVVKKKK